MKVEAELAKSGVLLLCFRKHFMKDAMFYKITFCFGLKNVFHSLLKQLIKLSGEIIWPSFKILNAIVMSHI